MSTQSAASLLASDSARGLHFAINEGREFSMIEKRFAVTDAHGRLVTLTPGEQQPEIHIAPVLRPRQPRSNAVVTIAGIFVGGAVAVVLLIVIRDVATTVAGGGITGLLLQGLLKLCNRRER
jgi:hypothetical protein